MSTRDARLIRIDAGVAFLLALDLILEAALARGVPADGRLPTILAAVPFTAAIAARRRWPCRALLGGMLVALIQQLLRGQLFTTLPSESAVLVPILCSYGVGAWVELRRGLLALAGAGVMLYGVALIATYAQHAPGAPGWAGGLGVFVFFLGPPWVVGWILRERGRRAEAFTELERQTVAERAQRERAAIAEERAMIGRELQDIIAHSVSVMVVQAGGARRLLTEQPARARESILSVEETGREALAEMRRLLGVMRRDDDPRALAPQPGLDQLPELVAAVESRGLRCDLETVDLEALTPGVDLVSYRVLEAALDGVATCDGRDARVFVRSRPGRLEIDVSAQVGPQVAERLVAVRQRVELYGGRLEVEELGTPPDGVAIRCRLPLGVAVAA